MTNVLYDALGVSPPCRPKQIKVQTWFQLPRDKAKANSLQSPLFISTTICILLSSPQTYVKAIKLYFQLILGGCNIVEDKGTMAKEASKQSKFKHFILSPIRFLKKARQIYMKCVVECAGGYGYGAATPSGHHISHLPMTTNSVNLNALRPSGTDEGQRELLRTVPIRNNVGNETRVVMHRQRQPFVGYKYNRMKMSYSPEVRKMERIDEEQPCYFEEDQMGFKTHLFYLYPRRRSNVVVNMRTVYNQRRLKDDMQDACSSKKGDSV